MRETIMTSLEENRRFSPPENPQANVSSEQYQALCRQFDRDREGTWRQLALTHLSWHKPFTRVLNRDKPPFFTWFEDGELNVSVNCLDRHIKAGRGECSAILWEGEPGEVRRISYNELLEQVCRAANAMRELGVTAGDRVAIYMPMIPEAAIAMLACTRIGAVHSVVFGAFSAQALRERIDDAGAKLVITADGGWRRGNVHALKPNVDEA
ncbi:MAG: acetyl-coenzyme A synthetase, partial [Zetaproteobacteria bacterium]